MEPSFCDIIEEIQKEKVGADIAIGTPTDDGIPLSICSLDGKIHTFMVSDFVNTKLSKTVTHVQRKE